MSSKPFETNFPSETIKEGNTAVLVPKLKAFVTEPSEYAPSKAPVFYNPVMELNRDISVLALQTYQRRAGRTIRICEPLASSGVRGVRYAVEIQGVDDVLINDISTQAVELAQHNVALNEVQEKVHIAHKDANCLLSCHSKPRQRFDIVDLDPFGTPVPYLSSAIRATRNKGVLALTATDLAPLCGVHPKSCLRKYGGKPLRTEYCHELAVRLMAGCTAALTAKLDIGLNVLFSHSTDHYIRVYAEIGYGAKKADDSIKSLGYILHCFNCLHRETTNTLFNRKTECPECGSNMDYSGPLWLGTILEKKFCQDMLEENKQKALKNSIRITKLLSTTQDESDAPPTYFILDKISAKLTLPVPPVAAVLQELRKRGFHAVQTHFSSRGIKTNASALEMQKIVRHIAK